MPDIMLLVCHMNLEIWNENPYKLIFNALFSSFLSVSPVEAFS